LNDIKLPLKLKHSAMMQYQSDLPVPAIINPKQIDPKLFDPSRPQSFNPFLLRVQEDDQSPNSPRIHHKYMLNNLASAQVQSNNDNFSKVIANHGLLRNERILAIDPSHMPTEPLLDTIINHKSNRNGIRPRDNFAQGPSWGKDEEAIDIGCMKRADFLKQKNKLPIYNAASTSPRHHESSRAQPILNVLSPLSPSMHKVKDMIAAAPSSGSGVGTYTNNNNNNVIAHDSSGKSSSTSSSSSILQPNAWKGSQSTSSFHPNKNSPNNNASMPTSAIASDAEFENTGRPIQIATAQARYAAQQMLNYEIEQKELEQRHQRQTEIARQVENARKKKSSQQLKYSSNVVSLDKSQKNVSKKVYHTGSLNASTNSTQSNSTRNVYHDSTHNQIPNTNKSLNANNSFDDNHNNQNNSIDSKKVLEHQVIDNKNQNSRSPQPLQIGNIVFPPMSEEQQMMMSNMVLMQALNRN
jgi:hypothetical protein